MATIIRRSYSNPPAHGAYIVSTVLNNPTLFGEWKNNVRAMYERIHSMRQLFYNKLKQLGTPGTWEHIIQQTGKFNQKNILLKYVFVFQRHVCLYWS
jgi:aspartate aminotransferase